MDRVVSYDYHIENKEEAGMFTNTAKLRNKASDFCKERNITVTGGTATMITQGNRARIRFLNKKIDKEWIAYCKDFNIPNDETLEY